MTDFAEVLRKLNDFVKKYYANELLKGTILFVGLGLLIFLLITGVEYFLWLNSTGRLILLGLLMVAEIYLLYRFIGIPLSFLLRLRKGIDNKTASNLIGKHFPEVSDKLTNLLDLSENKSKSDLLSASISQKSTQLSGISFVSAINFKNSLRFVKVLAIPALILLAVVVSGRANSFFDSYNRVKNYDMAYAPPAPFEFSLMNNRLNFLEGENVVIELQTLGDVVPDEVTLKFNGNDYLMQSNGNTFSHQFGKSINSGFFHFEAGGYSSAAYELVVGAVPVINNFTMRFDYPDYLNRKSEIVSGTGNGLIPEGTRISWILGTEEAEDVTYKDADTTLSFQRKQGKYTHKKSVFKSTDYTIATSNNNVRNYEELIYRIDVIKDGMPKIEVKQSIDSLTPNESYYKGMVSDDYGVRSTALVYYPAGSPNDRNRVVLSRNTGTGNSFEYVFPSGLELAKGVNYQLYFEVTDNDGIHRGKIAKSQIFNATIFDADELRDKELNSYKSVLDEFQDNIDKVGDRENILKEINESQKETQALTYNDKKNIKDFLQKQKSQEEMMKSFSEKLSKDLEKTKDNSEFNELLKERWLRQEIEAEKNRKLLEELNKIADKIEKEELQNKLEELAKKQSSGKRNLEQLLELTKRYYVTEKANQLANELDNLSMKQEVLSKVGENEKFNEKEQKALNDEYKGLDEGMEELKKDNQDLKKPLDLNIDKSTQEGVKEDQKEALEEIQRHGGEEQSSSSSDQEQNKEKAAGKMGAAAQKMKKLSEGLRQSTSMSGGGGSSIAEDAEMLRQILENLVTFSFKQEDLFDKVSNSDYALNQISSAVKRQQELRGMFEHVDDSLFALSLRQPDLSEFVNEQITEVYYNIDKSLENIAENQVYQGASYQQYVLNSSNSLADYLAKMLDNMQQSLMQGQGQGQGDGFQLPDIIKAQQQLGEKMGQMTGQGQKGAQQKEGQEGSEGKENGQKNGKKGQQGQNQKGEGKGPGDAEGKGEGKDGDGQSSSGGDLSEQNLSEVYEIFKEQQSIRQALEEQLSDIISNPDNELAKKLVKQMEAFENDLLENGITDRTVNRMNNIKHQLMKLENAALKQGKKQDRESKSNERNFTNPNTTSTANKGDNKPSVEILSRQALPLREKLSKKVQGYFEKGNQSFL